MEKEQAKLLADKFPEWVSNLFKDSAIGAVGVVRWFIITLYDKGYVIKKRDEE